MMTRYEVPTLFEIGEFSVRTRWSGGGWLPDFFIPYYH